LKQQSNKRENLKQQSKQKSEKTHLAGWHDGHYHHGQLTVDHIG
jgi:hypothetical protein